MNIALKKINARAKQLKKKHPGKKYKTLQKQAGAEYRAGKLKAKRKPAKKKTVRKVAKKRAAPKKARRVSRVAAIKYKGPGLSLGAMVKRKKKKTVVKARAKYSRSYGSKVGGMKSMMPIIAIGGLGLLAYYLLKPTAVPALYQSANVTRNAASNNILQYATAAGLTVSALTALINSLNSMSDNDVINAGSNPAAAIPQLSGPTATVQAPTGGLLSINV